MYDLRKEIFEHLQRLPMSFFDRSPVGRLVTRATTDVDALNDLFASGVAAMLNDFVMLFGLAGLAVLSEPPAGAGRAFSAAVHDPADLFLPQRSCATPTAAFARPSRGSMRSCRSTSAGWPWCSFSTASGKSRAQFAELNRIHMDAYKDAIDAFSLFYPGVEFLSMGGIALLYWVGGVRVIARDGANRRVVRVHDVRAAVLPADSGPERKIQYPADGHGRVRAHFPAARRAGDDCFRGEGAHARRAARRDRIPQCVVRLHAAARTRKKMTGCCATFPSASTPGETLAIVGHTGAGKTTMIQLLLRFYDIQRGQILLDGIDIRELELETLRQMFGIVLQDPFLFTGTLESNVKLGTETIDRAATERALREVGPGAIPGFPAAGRRIGSHRARLDAFGGPAATGELRARAGARSEIPDSR